MNQNEGRLFKTLTESLTFFNVVILENWVICVRIMQLCDSVGCKYPAARNKLHSSLNKSLSDEDCNIMGSYYDNM